MTITYHIDDIEQVARQVIAYSKNDVFVFNAPMGAGKTTLIKTICEQLGVKDEISSPTFSIVNEYKGLNRKIFHFDLYRVEQEEELFNIGIEDYLSQNAIVLIEWPELVIPYLEHYTALSIEVKNTSVRTLSIQ